jgi:adenosylhomocysteine nucleosidase
MILVLIPTRHEADDFINRLSNRRAFKPDDGGRIIEGKLHGRLVAVAEIGMGGTVAAKRAAIALASMQRPEVVWLAGYGGGLDPSLKRGEIALWERTPGALPPAAPLPPHRRVNRIHTAEEVIATPADKARLFAATGAPVVEMEADAVFCILDANELPAAAVRVVSDAADEALPADLLAHGYDPVQGRETPLRMAWRLITHPGDIRRLKNFLAPLPVVRRSLADFLEAAVKARAEAEIKPQPAR